MKFCECNYIRDIYEKGRSKAVNRWISKLRKKIITDVKLGYDSTFTYVPGPVVDAVAEYFRNEQFRVITRPYMDGREFYIEVKWVF